jgi:hypothetical protein
MAPWFRPGGHYEKLIQRVLDDIEPWSGDSVIRHTLVMRGARLCCDVVPVKPGAERLWGIHAGHTAREPGLSPFCQWPGAWPQTNALTVSLSGYADRCQLTSVYPGEYRPGLPWMSSRDVPLWESTDYWSNHAFVVRGRIMRATSAVPPRWYQRECVQRDSANHVASAA